MNALTWLENRLADPADDETSRRQKGISSIPGIFTPLITLAWAVVFYAIGLPNVACLLIVYTLVNFGVIFLMLAKRVTARPLLILGITAILINVAAHLAIGGFDGGIWFLVWVVIFPLTVYLSGAHREGAVVLGLALVGMLLALIVDPSLPAPPPIPDWVRLSYNGFVLFTATIMLFVWSVVLLQQLNAARLRADNLLLNILPAPIATQLKRSSAIIADGYDEVTVLFADIVNFTTLSADADPVDVVGFLNTIFSDFDDLTIKHGLEKIKTIGDAYMVAGGLPVHRPDHCEAVVAFAIDMLAACQGRTAWHGEPVHLRVGVNTGPVVAGVIGRHKFIYDLWGDAVNTASRMESNGVADMIQVTASVRDKLAGKYRFDERPPMYIKGKGEMVTYLLTAK